MSSVQVTGFSLTDTPVLEYFLSDIPLFCLGITALALFTFFVFMGRLNLAASYLYASSLFAFGGAIFDISQILERGIDATNENAALGTVTGLIDAREVAFALAFGTRYLYLWAFVAQRPRHEPRSVIGDALHSASWLRWGVPGLLLKFGLLGAVLAIPILQILWRIDTGNSPVYTTESALQIGVSILLLAKLLLNLFLSTVCPWWRPFVPYIVPVLALLVNAGLGTGNVLFFKFTETTLGRFLQAVATYMLLLNMLLVTFYNVPPPDPAEGGRKTRMRSSFFTRLPKSIDMFAALASPTKNQEISSPAMFEIVQRPFAPAYGRSDSRESRISRIGSWILTPKRKAPRPPSGEQKLWDNSDAELGLGSQARADSPSSAEDVLVLSPRVQILEDKRPTPEVSRSPVAEKSPMKETLADEKPRTPLAVNTTQPPEPPASATLEVTTPSTDTRPHTGVSFSSYYGMATASRLTLPSSLTRGQGTRGTDSPIYGLDGIIPPPAPESPILSSQPNPDPDSSFLRPVSSAMSTMTALQRTSGNSFDELLRQQTELDKSIAALRLFSSSSADTLDPSPVEVLTRESKVTEPRSISMSSAKSKGSEFSLSVFPDPPLVNRASELPEMLMGDLPFPRRMQSRVAVPTSATSDLLGGGLHGRFDSGATQYEITSFIGDLTIPGLNPGHSSDHSESDIETPVITTAQPSLRPLFLSSTSPAITSLPSNPAVGLNNNSGSPTGTSGSSASPSHEYPILRPLLLGSTVPSVPSPLSAGARRTPGGSFGRKASSASATRRPTISGPKQVEDDDAEQAAAAFVSPRPAPVHK